jgi:methyl-accepting chemotaxis protein
MSIRRQLWLASLAALFFVLLVGGVGFASAERLVAQKKRIVMNATALRLQMQADMMHDALRSDVLSAMLAGSEGATDAKATVDAELKDHLDTFNGALRELSELPLQGDTQAAVKAVQPALQAYGSLAKSIADTAFSDLAAAKAKRSEFDGAFKKLEDEMEQLSTTIETSSNNELKVGEQAESLTRWLIGSMAVGGGLVLYFLCNWIAKRVAQPVRRAAKAAEIVAGGDLSQEIRIEGSGETRQLLEALSEMQRSLSSLVSSVNRSSESIATGSAEIAMGSTDLSQRTEETAAQLQRTTGTMSELTDSVRHTADTAAEAASLVGRTASVATEGGEAMGRVVQTMEEINAASRRIADITGVIDSIAFQTNILALNAAVEAARAGEQGRGFAVVAGEVRQLAQRAAGAAHEIKDLIDDSVSKVQAGGAQVAEAGRTMAAINAQVQQVAALIGGMDAASQTQRQGIEALDSAVRQVDQLTQQNAALVEESAAAAESLKQQAAQMADLVHRFKLAS